MSAIPVQLSWMPPSEGGRAHLPKSGYRPVAQLPGDQHAFSVTLDFADEGAREHPAMLSVLLEKELPDVMTRLRPGTELEIREGRRVVARALFLPSDNDSGVMKHRTMKASS